MAVFLNILNRWESAELNQEEAAELLGGERADVPALDAPLRGGGRGWTLWTAGSARRRASGSRSTGPRSGAALSRALPGLHGQALSRASGEGPRLRLGLHLDQASSSVDGGGRESAAQGGASEEARAAAAAGMMLHQDGSRHGWLEGQEALDLIVTMDGATGRSIRCSWWRRRARPRPSGRRRRCSAARPADEPLHRPRGALLSHPQSRRRDRPRPSHPGRAAPGSQPMGANISEPCIDRRAFVVEARAGVGAKPPGNVADERRSAGA